MIKFDAEKKNSQDNETAASGDPCYKVLLRPKPWSNSKYDEGFKQPVRWPLTTEKWAEISLV